MPNVFAAVAEPEVAEPVFIEREKKIDREKKIEKDKKLPDNVFNVVLLNDDDHSYEYVIEMLMKLFFVSKSQAFRHAEQVDQTGRTIVITCGKPEADYAKDQIQNYGADPRIVASKGSMSAIVEPA